MIGLYSLTMMTVGDVDCRFLLQIRLVYFILTRKPKNKDVLKSRDQNEIKSETSLLCIIKTEIK